MSIDVIFDKNNQNPSIKACRVYLDALAQLVEHGQMVSPRGQLCQELLGKQLVFGPRERFLTFPERKLNVDYIKRETLWYLRGDRFDKSICRHAKIWGGIVSPDGGIESNYGQYLFGRALPNHLVSDVGISRVVDTLVKDPSSRRAAVVILDNQHLDQPDLKDYPCTCTLNFHVRDNKVVMHVHMRSQDAVYGLGNDLPFFSIVHEMVQNLLNSRAAESYELGNLYLTADSWHVYAKHFPMVANILENGKAEEFDCPKMVPGEAKYLLEDAFISRSKIVEWADKQETIDAETTAEEEPFEFTRWLLSVKAKEVE